MSEISYTINFKTDERLTEEEKCELMEFVTRFGREVVIENNERCSVGYGHRMEMNYDYAYCADYETNKSHCPKSCLRGQLVRYLEKNPRPCTSWMHFAGTDKCPLQSFTIIVPDRKDDI